MCGTYDSAMSLMGVELPPVGCILTDFHMPEIDGLQLQLQLAARGIRLPVIVMTGHGDVPVAVRAMKAGALDFLEKPFDDRQLSTLSSGLSRITGGRSRPPSRRWRQHNGLPH